ncbi:MAG: tol-pal system protein YbgF [Alphaproteobacteria bacterium]|nr:tol-pal system protein YbgF [Alphaproteobacteria bacterium]
MTNQTRKRTGRQVAIVLLASVLTLSGTAVAGSANSTTAVFGLAVPGLAVPGLAVPGLTVLEVRADTLSARFETLAGQWETLEPAAPVVARFRVAQRRQNAQSAVRLDQLEEQMRILTGQIEGLQFQMTQMQTLLTRMQEDFEFRFSELEGGGLGKTEAAPRSDSGSLSGAVPPAINRETELTPVPGLDPNLAATVQPLGTLSAGGLDVNLDGPAFDGTGALDLDLNPGNLVTNADAEAQYQAGFNALQRGDFEFAEQQFTQFLSLYPTHRLAPDAANWLGEVLLARGAYDEAAAVLVNGFERYPDASRSPDILLKLGISLARAGERETACRTYVEVLRRFPGQPGAFMARVSEEQRTAQC